MNLGVYLGCITKISGFDIESENAVGPRRNLVALSGICFSYETASA